MRKGCSARQGDFPKVSDKNGDFYPRWAAFKPNAIFSAFPVVFTLFGLSTGKYQPRHPAFGRPPSRFHWPSSSQGPAWAIRSLCSDDTVGMEPNVEVNSLFLSTKRRHLLLVDIPAPFLGTSNFVNQCPIQAILGSPPPHSACQHSEVPGTHVTPNVGMLSPSLHSTHLKPEDPIPPSTALGSAALSMRKLLPWPAGPVLPLIASCQRLFGFYNHTE